MDGVKIKNEIIGNNKTELIIYEFKDGNIKLDVNLESDTVWLSFDQKAKLEYGKYQIKELVLIEKE